MKEKNFSISKIKKSEEKNLYVFFNIEKGIGIRRMRQVDETNIKIGEEVIIDGQRHILTTIFDFKNGEMISLIQNL